MSSRSDPQRRVQAAAALKWIACALVAAAGFMLLSWSPESADAPQPSSPPTVVKAAVANPSVR
jgi:hypothetical protein